MINDLFPDKIDPKIDDNDWLDYCIGTWCLNSVEATKTLFRKPCNEARENNSEYVQIKLKDLEQVDYYLQRMSRVYCWLYSFWRKEKGVKTYIDKIKDIKLQHKDATEKE